MRLDEEIRGAMSDNAGAQVPVAGGERVPSLLHGRWAIAPEAWSKVVSLTQLAARTNNQPVLSDRELHDLAMQQQSRKVQAARQSTQQAQKPVSAVSVISLSGVIRPKASGLLALLFGLTGGLEAFREAFLEAMGDSDIGAVVLDIDSPGGVTDMVPETAAMIRKVKGQTGKKVVAVANTMAASAAYYIASAADEIYVTPSGFVGSIGVFTVHDDWSGFNERVGVDPTYIYAGKYKVEGNPDEPLSDSAKKAMQTEVDEFYNMFIDDVAEGRGISSADVRDGYGEGRTLTAKRAKKAGMVDGVQTLDETIAGLFADSSGGGGGAKADDDDKPDVEMTELQRQTADALSF